MEMVSINIQFQFLMYLFEDIYKIFRCQSTQQLKNLKYRKKRERKTSLSTY